MFTDQAKIYIQAGNGGAGKSSFLREKYRPNGGPDGGDGGNGGSVYIVARKKLNSLNYFRNKKEFKAKNGQPGASKCMFGKKGQDLYIEVPCGTIIKKASGNAPFQSSASGGRQLSPPARGKQNIIRDGGLQKGTGTFDSLDLTEPDKPYLIAKGGKGGLGNAHFATSRKQAPRYAQPGLPGEEFDIEMELKLIADIGLVGLPNAGKSTLLKALTNANPKIASYQFTTLSPNLGVLKIYDQELVIADIPGLIEGAADGVGLGHDFLRHIERTKYLLHIVDVSGFSGDPVEGYKTIYKELKSYSSKLVKKGQLIVLNKIDVPESAEYIKEFRKEVKHKELVEISAVTGEGLDELRGMILKVCK